MEDRYLVTGAMGCLGAWTIRLLVDEGADVVAFDLSADDRRLRLLLDDDDLADVRCVTGDIGDTEAVARVVRDEGITHIIHLAALQVPFCRADPVAGARVNVVGTVNVFEAALANRDSVRGLAYASSVAVYGGPDRYGPVVGDDARQAPETLYGAYKQANEATARVYAADHGLASAGLRPYIIYGPGRDQGLTSSATVAMLAAAAGQPFDISHGGTALYQYASDCARIFIDACRVDVEGAATLNVGGPSVSMEEIVAAIEDAAPEVAGRVTFRDVALPFPPQLDASGLDRLLDVVRYTDIRTGVAETVELFRKLLAEGKVSPPA
jgi:UDP-glucuronate 4-epimerase